MYFFTIVVPTGGLQSISNYFFDVHLNSCCYLKNVCSKDVCFIFWREFDHDNRKSVPKEDVIALYNDLEELLRSQDFEEDLRNELEKSCCDYLKILNTRREDMVKPDHAIVLAGM